MQINRRWPLALLTSLLLIVPCFWHRHLEAGDLNSHIYNAWLAELIEHGRAPGLHLEVLHSNIFFDQLLSLLGPSLGWSQAGMFGAAFAVLLFFWATFAFISATTGQAPWTLAPLLTMVAYGWTFNRGLMNYYLSLGFSFLALAVVWRAQGWKRISSLIFVPLMVLAHPLGAIWFFSAASYVVMAQRLGRRGQALLFIGAALALVAVHYFLWTHYRVGSSPEQLRTGLDQLFCYQARGYKQLAIALILFLAICFIGNVLARKLEPRDTRPLELLVQLYLLAELGLLLLPDFIFLPSYPTPLSHLSNRLSLISAVLALAILGTMKPRRWRLLVFACAACLQFCFLYRDTGQFDRLETEMERSVQTLPPGARVISGSYRRMGDQEFLLAQLLDRACIGRCFSFNNYEARSGQFRVRASPANGIVAADRGEVSAASDEAPGAHGRFFPIWLVYLCKGTSEELCLRALPANR